MKNILRTLIADEDAAAMAEYGLLLVLVVLLAFVAVVILGDGISTFFSRTGGEFEGASIPTIP